MAGGIVVGLVATLVIFVLMRAAAKPAPHTMNKEWQEAANEYLKVRSIPCLLWLLVTRSSYADPTGIGTKIRPLHWHCLPRLQGQGTSPVSPIQGLGTFAALAADGQASLLYSLEVSKAESLPRGCNSIQNDI